MTSPDVISIAKTESLVTTKEINGIWSAKMRILSDDYIGSENYIDIDGEEYIVKSLKKIKSAGQYYYDVTLHHNMTELADLTIDRFSYLKTVSALLTLLLTGTGWTAGTVDITETISLVMDRRCSVLEALNLLAERCGGELDFHSKTRIVDLKRQIGTVTGLQLRYDKTCDYIEKEEDSSNLVTRIYPYGPDNFSINTTILDNCEDETLYTGSGSATLAASTIKQNGSQAIQATFTAVNETVIRDLGAGDVIDVRFHDTLKFWIYSATDNASGFTFGIGESAYNEFTVNTGALTAGNWQEITVDLTTIEPGTQDEIRYIGLKNLTTGAAVVVFDMIRAFNGLTYIDSANRTLYKVNKEYAYFHSAKVEKTQFEVVPKPIADSHTYQPTPGTNFGTETTLKVLGTSSYIYNMFLKWDLSSIPADATIVSATLYLYVYGLFDASLTSAQTYLCAADWTESALTYTNQPATSGADIHTFDFSSVGWKDCGADMSTTVQNWVDASVANYGITIRTAQSAGVWIYSKEGLEKPYLKIVYTIATNPEPIIVAAATKYLAEHDEPILKYKVKAVDLSKAMADTWEDETINLGDTVRIYDTDLDLNVDVRVKKITRDLLNTENITLELANKASSIIDTDVKRSIQLSYAMPYQDNNKIIDANAMQAGYIGSDVNV